MTVYTFSIDGLRPALAVVAAHGATDLDRLDCLAHYAAWLLLPCPGEFITALFLASSTLHFAEDVGLWGSILVMATTGVLHFCGNTERAFQFMFAYLLVVHTPMHYARCIDEGCVRGLFVAAIATLCMLSYPRRLLGERFFVMGHGVQRIVLAHIAHEMAKSQYRTPKTLAHFFPH